MYRSSVFSSCATLDVREDGKEQMKPSRRHEGFILSALGKKMASAFNLRKGQVSPICNLNENQRMIYRKSQMPSDGESFWLRRLSSIRVKGALDEAKVSKRISASPSFRVSSLPGLSYVASFNNDYERPFHKGFSLEQAAKVVSSSSFRSKALSSAGSVGCKSPCDVFTSFSDDSEDGESPFFDPDLLNVFERALEQLPLPCTEETTLNDRSLEHSAQTESNCRQIENLGGGSEPKESNSRRKRLSFGSLDEFRSSIREKKDTKIAKRNFEALLANSRAKKEEINLKRIVSAITSSDYASEYPNSNLLDMFQFLCPPEGEHKVVLFLTSLRGVRKTYENCSSIRTVLFGYGVKIDERDVSMHSDYRRELKDLFGKYVSLPRLFIRGRYVGGVEEVMQLNEDGVLAKLLEDVPRTTSRACEGCGDIRFIPCVDCRGSCKVVSYESNKVVRCPCCNENGLVRCTICC